MDNIKIKRTRWKVLNDVISNGDRESAHVDWEDALLDRLRKLGDTEFTKAAERVRCEVGFWYA